MNWTIHLSALAYQDPGGRFSFRQALRPPATADQIVQAELRLQIQFPDSLRSLLLETNGVMRMMSVEGQDWFEELWTIWPIEQLVQENLWHRKQYCEQSLDRLVFFAGAGADGILFGFPHISEPVNDLAVYAWYPDESESQQMAAGLGQFLAEWSCGKLSV